VGDHVPKNEKEEKERRKREVVGNDELNFDVKLQWVKDMMGVLASYTHECSDKIRLSYRASPF
jgi:hypothetical protein